MSTRPTPDDLVRDGPADLAACNAATPGPWVLRPRRRLTEVRCDFSGTPGRTVLGWTVALAKWLKPPDAAFIALARAALPAWIRRALAAEAELARVTPAVAPAPEETADRAAEPLTPEEPFMATEKQLEKRALKAQEARRRAQERAHKAHALAGDALDAFSVAVAEEETAFKELRACRQAALSPPARDETLCVPEDEE